MKVEIKTLSFGKRLSKDAKTTLFRVAQEALTNIERHACADHVRIELSVPKGTATLCISDNGKGFDAHSLNGKTSVVAGIGLSNMQERLEQQNGELQVISSAKGTTIQARLLKKLLRVEIAQSNLGSGQ